MAFLSLNATPSAAVATNGTIAFTLANASLWGQVKNEGGHQMYSRGLQAMFNFNAGDFTLSASSTTVTLTYKGTSTIPANTLCELQLQTAGENNYLGDGKGTVLDQREVVKDAFGNIRANVARPIRVEFGAPATASATAILNAQALAVTTVVTLATPFIMDVPRGLTIKSSGADTAVITFRGFDEYNVAMSESLTLNGTSAVNGKKAFKTVVSYQAAAGAPSNNLSIGTQAGVFGLPFFLAGGTSAGAGYILKEVQDGTVATAGTFVGGDLTTPATATTGDVRGTWTPNGTPNGTIVFEVVAMATDLSFKGIAQYGA